MYRERNHAALAALHERAPSSSRSSSSALAARQEDDAPAQVGQVQGAEGLDVAQVDEAAREGGEGERTAGRGRGVGAREGRRGEVRVGVRGECKGGRRDGRC